MPEPIATIDATGSGAAPQEPATPGTGATPPANPEEPKSETPSTPEHNEPATPPSENEPNLISETKGLAATRDQLMADVTRLREEKRVLGGATPPATPPTEGQPPATPEPKSPEAQMIEQMRTENMGLALKEIYQSTDFDLIHPAKDTGNENWTQVKTIFDSLYPNGFTTKEGYLDGLTRAYAAAFPAQYAEAAATRARADGQIEGAGLKSADIGGKSSSINNAPSATLSTEDKRMLAAYNRNKPAEQQMSEGDFLSFRDNVTNPDFDWKGKKK